MVCSNCTHLVHRKIKSFPALILLLITFSLSWRQAEGVNIFSSQPLTVEGKVLSIIPADLNGNGFVDLIVVHKTGIYPTEHRWISVFWFHPLTRYSTAAMQRWEIDPAATVLDVGEVAPTPGQEILYLTRQGINIYVQEKEGYFSPVPQTLLSSPTFTVFPEPGALPRGNLLGHWKGNGLPLLLLPQFDALHFFRQDSQQQWQLAEEVQVTPRTFLLSAGEEDGFFRDYSLQVAYRLPRIVIEDFNGDGRPDLLLPRQEYLAVYLQQPNGRFASTPSLTLFFAVRSAEERTRQHLLILKPVDVNRDGFVDVVITKVTGKLLEQKVTIMLFLHTQNPAKPFSSQPTQTLSLDGFTPGVTIEDVNGDGKGDLFFSSVQVGLWDIIKNLLSNQVTIVTAIHLFRTNHYSIKPDFEEKTDYAIDLSDGIRLQGVWPTLAGDFTGDGHKDLLIARDRKVMIYPKRQNGMLFAKPFTQTELPTSPYLQVVDVNGDGKDDLIFYQKESPVEKGQIFVLLNKGLREEESSRVQQSSMPNGR